MNAPIQTDETVDRFWAEHLASLEAQDQNEIKGPENYEPNETDQENSEMDS